MKKRLIEFLLKNFRLLNSIPDEFETLLSETVNKVALTGKDDKKKNKKRWNFNFCAWTLEVKINYNNLSSSKARRRQERLKNILTNFLCFHLF